MRTKRIILFVIYIFCVVTSYSQEIINYFQVDDNIATPVIIHTSKGKFSIYGGERIDGNLYGITAYDANGNKIVQNTPYKTETASGEPTIRYYYFKNTYKSSEEYDTDTDYEENNGSYDNYGSDSGSWGTQLGQKLNNATDRARMVYMEGYPNLQVRAGWSAQFGEIISLKAELGQMGGSVLAGGVGKNLFNPNQNSLTWFAEVGWYMGDDIMDFSFDIICGRNLSENFLLAALFEYSYYFDLNMNPDRLGVFAAAQYGLYWGTSMHGPLDFITKAAWDFRIGVTWKLFSN